MINYVSCPTLNCVFPLCSITASELRIVLLGKSDDKKTKLGNFIIGDEECFNFQKNSSFQQCVATAGEWRGKSLTVVKTPDIFSFPENTVRTVVKRFTDLCSPGPNVLLLLVKPSDFKAEYKQRLDFIMSLFGQNGFKYSMVIMTQKENETGISVQLLKECGGRQYNMSEKDHKLLMERIENMVHENYGTFLTFNEDMKPALNLVLCGRRGAGKTSVAKAILGQTELPPVSSSVCVKHQTEVWGRRVSLVELPALYGKLQKEMMEESLRFISLFHPEGAHAFILVLPVGPLTDEDKVEIQTIQNTFSSRVNDFTMILFTVESDPFAPAVRNFINGSEDIKKLCQSCGGRYEVLNIKNQQQIPELLNTIDERRAHKDKAWCYTTETFTQAQIEKIIQQQAEIENLKNPSVLTCKYFTLISFYFS